MKENFFCKKIAIYLHDPFEKTLAITPHGFKKLKHISNYKKCADSFGGAYKSHEKLALCNIKEALNRASCKGRIEELFKLAKEYDVLSATLDRWVVYGAPTEKRTRENGVRFVNPFDPSFTYDVGRDVDVQKIDEYYNFLWKIIAAITSNVSNRERPKYVYHILYGLAEPLWYEKVGKVEVADTRSPTHTIFDHLSASVGVSNIFEGKEFKGYLVEVDIPGIQSFIAGGRGPGDLWIRSWLISAMVWYMIKELVWELGADIMLSPTARYNPFYYSLLREKMLPKLNSNEFKEFLENLPAPDQPVMPGTVTLLLPDEAKELVDREKGKNFEEKLESYFKHRLEKAWKEAVEKAKKQLSKFRTLLSKGELCIKEKDGIYEISECNGERSEEVEKDIFEKLAEELDGLKPPLQPSVTVIDVSEAYKEFEDKFETFKRKYENEVKSLFKEIKETKSTDSDDNEGFFPYAKEVDQFWEDVKRKLFFHWLLTYKYINEVKKRKKISVNNRVREGWTVEKSKKNYEEGHITRLCACGRPAIIHNNTNSFIAPLRPRETLCPYCFVMRLMQYDRSKRVFEVFVGNDAQKINAPRIQMLTLAMLPELAKYLADTKLNVTDYKDVAKKLMNGVITSSSGNPLDMEEVLDKLRAGESTSYELSEGEIEIEFVPDDLKAIERLNKYVAMIKADADGMGDLKSGRLNMSPSKYFNKLFDKIIDQGQKEKVKEKEEKVVRLLDLIINGFYETVYPKQVGVTIDEEGIKVDEKEQEGPSTLVTPSYIYQLSYAIMIEALRDKDIVKDNYGVVVYSGGDDLLALVPARAIYGMCLEPLGIEHVSTDYGSFVKENYCSPALWVWWLTRLNHWGMGERPEGFFKGGHYFAPAPLAYGRKYGIAIRHYRDPLAMVFEEADELERKAKIFVKTFMSDDIRLEKDGVAVSYGRAGSAQGAALPNTLPFQSKRDLFVSRDRINQEKYSLGEYLAKVIKLVNDRVISRNYIYDLEQCGRLFKAKCEGTFNVIENVIVATIKRNATKGHEEEVARMVRKMLERIRQEAKCVIVKDDAFGSKCPHVFLVRELIGMLREWSKATR